MTDDKMTDEALLQLRQLKTTQPSPEAKKLALNAAMAAFDAAQPKREATRAPFWTRWKIGAGLGVPLGTAIAALVVLPVGTQLYTANSHRVDGLPPGDVSVATASQQATTVPEPAPQPSLMAVTPPQEDEMAGEMAAPIAERSMTTRETMAKVAPSPMVSSSVGFVAMPSAVPFAPTGDSFAAFDENGVQVTAEAPVSTFSIDVDTASYAYVRSLLEDGYLPQPDAVRTEELINYFPYDYPAPTDLDTPFRASMTVIPTPWNAKTQLLEIGIKGYVPPAEARQPENLTFLIDTSGSMDEPNKLPLLQRAFGLLVDTLQADDTVSIVTYAGSAGVVLKPTKVKDRSSILDALRRLYAGGPTNGSDGLALAYRVNEEAQQLSHAEDGINRIILATDGDFNVGLDSAEQMKSYIRTQRDKGIFLSVLGFGRGNLDDALMQSLAQNGNGNASYIDSFREAQKVLVEEGGANLVTIAKDVKIQVEFNPATVSEYRLIGYETRSLKREDFNNDAVDAGEIGAGHTVTALYEITPAGSTAQLNDPLRYGASEAPATATASDELGFLKIRYKAPNGSTSKLIEAPITRSLAVDDLAQAGNDQRFAAAVAAFGQKLRQSNYGGAMDWQQIVDLANGAKGEDVNGYRAEFVQLAKLAALLAPDHSAGGRSACDDPSGGKGGCAEPAASE